LIVRGLSYFDRASGRAPPLVYTTLSQVTLRRPDKLKVITAGDGPPSEFYYDGKVMMAYEPATDLLAVAQAPPTIDAMLAVAYDSAATYFPFTDLIVADPYRDLAPTLRRAFYVGQSRDVGRTTTDIIVLVSDRMFAQLWIGAEDKLPRSYRATYLDDPSRLRQQVDFSGWKLDGVSDGESFTTPKAETARKIQFARPDPAPRKIAPPPDEAARPAGDDAAEKGK
jgi:hypothetical protein